MRDECFLIPRRRGGGGGGTLHAANSLIVRRAAAIGDVIAATCVADKLTDQGFDVEFQAHIGIHCVLRRHPTLARISTLNGAPHIDLDGAYEQDAGRRSRHFHDMFFEVANRQLDRHGLTIGKPRNCKPRLSILSNDRAAMFSQFAQYPKPWVFICPASNQWNVRQVPPYIWEAMASKVPATHFWLGTHPAPANIVDLKARHLDNIIMWLSIADLLVTVDTGPMHIAAALNVPIVAINQSSPPRLHLNDQNDFIEVSPTGLDCLGCQANICPKDRHLPPCQKVDPDLIAGAVNARLRAVTTEDVTAVVTIYQPEVGVLNRCLECLLPQVQEIIVTRESAGILPEGVNRDGKITYVVKNERGIGYGRNANYGARFANGKHLLIINDDVFLEPDAVQKMREAMTPGVGMVSNLLKYPDGTIYHAGKVRAAGVRGWGHIDYKKYLPTFKDVTEVENCCGACVLVRREAHFKIGGFDERFRLFAEDDAYALAIRKAGYKIMFTPHSSGTHLEHQTVNKLGNVMDFVNESNKLFGQLWGPYLDHNRDRVPLGNFDYA